MRYQALLLTLLLILLSCKKESDEFSGTNDPDIMAIIATQGISSSSDFFHFTLNGSIHFDGDYLLEKEMPQVDFMYCSTFGSQGIADRITWASEGINNEQDVLLGMSAHTEDMTIGPQSFDPDIHHIQIKVFTKSGEGIGGVYNMESGSINLLQHVHDLQDVSFEAVQSSTVMTFQGNFKLLLNEHIIQAQGVVKSTMD